MKKHNLIDNTMTESDSQVYNDHIYPRESIKNIDKGFVKIDNGLMGGTHWTCF